MSIEMWSELWVILLWGSAAAFGLVTLYILAGALVRLRASSGARDDG